MRTPHHTFAHVARLAGLIAMLSLAPLSAQAPAPPTILRSDSLEVLVDVVVRDKKGHLIDGLTDKDITITEDGVAQKITSFRVGRVANKATAIPAPAPRPKSAGPSETVQVSKPIRLVSMVLDRLGPDGRRLTRQACLDFLKRDIGDNVYYAVFTIDRGFRVVQAYTSDTERLRAAIERATTGERSNFESASRGLDSMAQATSGSQGAAAAAALSSAGGQGPGSVDGSSLSNEQASMMVKSMSDFSELISREDLGRMSVFSLWAVIKELKKLPGRKTVLYFAEGLQMPNGLVEQFKSMIGDANRSNVSVYAIDARGLTVASDQAAANQKLREAARWSQYARSTQNESAAENIQEFRTFDRALDSIRGNAQNEMRELAEATGGFLIANTNDLRAPLQKLSEDLNTYYEISYHPENQLPDGRFRSIAVKINRNDAVVQARNGYFSLPALDGQTVYPYEVPLLRALSSVPLAKELPFRSTVVRYRPHNGLHQSLLVFDLPLDGVAFTKDEVEQKYRTHVSVLALIKNEQGRVVAKLSRDVPLNEPLDRIAGFRSGRFIATHRVDLTPGRYTVESVAADREGQRLGARRAVLVVPAAPPGTGLSELVLVRRLDKPAEVPDPLDPLQLPTVRVVPTLADTVPGGKGKALSLFFLAYPDSANGQPPKLVLDLLKDGKVLSRSTPDLPPADSTGAVPFFANTPLNAVEAGQYQFRATLLQGEAASQKSLYFNVQ